MKTLDQAVIELSGVLPHKILTPLHAAGVGAIINYFGKIKICGDESDIGTEQEFQQRAIERGFINGYRWGVEYKTNGKRPDLPDDVVVDVTPLRNEPKKWSDDRVDNWIWDNSRCFEITDQRYKPADTSYLDKPTIIGIDLADGKDQSVEHIHNPDIGADWYDYDNQNAIVGKFPEHLEVVMVNPNSGIKYEVVGQSSSGSAVVQMVGDSEFKAFHLWQLKPLDYDRKAKAERKRVIDAAMPVFLDAYKSSSKEGIEALYDEGFLKLPGDSK